MTFLQFAAAYAVTALAFLGLDAVWLTSMADRLYRPALGSLMADKFALGPAAAFYFVYVAGIVGFAVAPAVASGSATGALLRGLALGFVAYATYDLTNQATLRGWPWSVTLADLAWGTVATGLAAWAAAAVVLHFGKG
ncbi:DUF2177 family protein [Ramlibacter sp. PS3R-8]|uniref:DUF2177 family protein n=1 Tax=Ramlibacter sp. PS3R-8 TaxID=3133437 RepID=UPI00309A6D48